MLVFVSGCTVPGIGLEIPFIPDIIGGVDVSYENDILVIKSLQAVPDRISPGQKTKLIAYVQNTGSETMEDVEVELYDYCPGVFGEPEVKKPGEKGYSSGSSVTIAKMLPEETKEVSWKLEAKEVQLLTTCPRDGMKVKVKYPYETTSVTTISFMNAEEMQRRMEEGKFETKKSYIALGQGPVKPVMKVMDTQPVASDSKKTAVSVEIENRGVGFVQESRVRVVDVTGPKGSPIPGEIYSCLKDRYSNGGIKLIQKKSPKIICQDISIPGKASEETEYTEHIELTISYDYEFRKSVRVTVYPKI